MPSSFQCLRALLAFASLGFVVGCVSNSDGSSAGSTTKASEAVSVSPERIGEAFGTVGGMPVGLKEFETRAIRHSGRDGDLDEALRREVVEQLVEEKLLYLDALARGVDKDPKIQKMMVNTLLKEQVYGQVRAADISEGDLETYFEAHKEEFVVPAKAKVHLIVLKPEEGQEIASLAPRAQAIHAEVQANPGDFAAIAKKYGKGPYARKGGDLGYMTVEGKPGVDPTVVAKAFAMAGTGITEVFETTEGLNIAYVSRLKPKVERNFAQMRGSVLRKVKAERFKQVYDTYVDGLRAEAAIEVDFDKVLGHSVSRAGSEGRPRAGGVDAHSGHAGGAHQPH